MTKPIIGRRPAPGSEAAVKAANGIRTRFISLDGKQIRPKDALWIVYNPKGEPVHFFTSEIAIMDDPAGAARVHWMGATAALRALNSGYRLELVSPEKFISDVVRNLVPDTTPENIRLGMLYGSALTASGQA